jgi:hypothetical protein
MIYFVIKTISLSLNVCFYLLIMYKVRPPPTPLSRHRQVYTLSGLQKDLITVMCGRLQYYCLVQIISRIGATWYKIQFGFRSTIDEPEGSLEATAFAFELLLSPSAGVGYLIVFLAMQPEASIYLQELIQETCPLFLLNRCCCGKSLLCDSYVHSHPKRAKRRIGSRPSEDTVSSVMEQRILEDLRNDSESQEEKQFAEKQSDGGNSWSSSFFLGDDQELSEELERLYSQRTGSGRPYSHSGPR